MPWVPRPVWTKWSTFKVDASMNQMPLRSMSATTNHLPSGVRRTSCGIDEALLARPDLAPPIMLACSGDVAPGVGTALRSMTLRTLVASRATTVGDR